MHKLLFIFYFILFSINTKAQIDSIVTAPRIKQNNSGLECVEGEDINKYEKKLLADLIINKDFLYTFKNNIKENPSKCLFTSYVEITSKNFTNDIEFIAKSLFNYDSYFAPKNDISYNRYNELIIDKYFKDAISNFILDNYLLYNCDYFSNVSAYNLNTKNLPFNNFIYVMFNTKLKLFEGKFNKEKDECLVKNIKIIKKAISLQGKR